MPIKSELLPHFQFPTPNKTARADVFGHIMSNETGLDTAVPILVKKRQQKPGGVGLIIGSGGIYSVLPYLNLDAVIVTDINPGVLRFTEFVGDCIVNAKSADDAVAKIVCEYPENIGEETHGSPVFEPSLDVLITRKLNREAWSFGNFHWSNPDRFEKAQEAIRNTTFAFAERDVQDPEFFRELTGVLTQVEQPLSYLNFTNIQHGWVSKLGFWSNQDLFDQWEGIGGNIAPVQYSTEDRSGRWQLTIKVADSFFDYYLATKREFIAPYGL